MQPRKPLTGLKFAIAGMMPIHSRTGIKRLICDNGGWVSDHVLRDTDYLILGDEAGSKQVKAIQLGIQIISEQELLAMIGTFI